MASLFEMHSEYSKSDIALEAVRNLIAAITAAPPSLPAPGTPGEAHARRMTPAYKQYLRAYINTLSGGLVACELMTVDGLDVVAIALGVAHAKRDIYNPERANPMSAADFSSALDSTLGGAPTAPAC